MVMFAVLLDLEPRGPARRLLNASPPLFFVAVGFGGGIDFCGLVWGVNGRELGADAKREKTSCCGLRADCGCGWPNFLGGGAEDFQRSANESAMAEGWPRDACDS